uniref:Uncharacterized protein n=1 Tax=Anguilla anguilla TaxID=7936 RepID=A0A0E9STK8_ANGAN
MRIAICCLYHIPFHISVLRIDGLLFPRIL